MEDCDKQTKLINYILEKSILVLFYGHSPDKEMTPEFIDDVLSNQIITTESFGELFEIAAENFVDSRKSIRKALEESKKWALTDEEVEELMK